MSKEITKEEKDKVINEEIERYFGESRKTLAEISSLYDVVRYNVEIISFSGNISRSVDYVKDVKRGVNGSYDSLALRLDEVYENFEKIIESARKAREKITSVKLAVGSIEALRKAL